MGLLSSKKTYNTYTGLGDEQFEGLTTQGKNLATDVASLDSSISTNQSETNQNFADASKQAEDNMNTIRYDVGTVGRTTNFYGEQTAEGIAGLGENLAGLGEDVGKGFTGVNQNIQAGTEAVAGVVDQRANEINENLYTMNDNNVAGFTSVNDNLETGFTGLANQNEGIVRGQSAGFAAIDDKVTGVGDTLSTGQSNLATQLEDTSTNLYGNQAEIIELIQKYGGDASQYYQDLSAGQTSIREGQGAMQTAFDTFRSDYNDDTALARQTRADMAQSIVGGFNATSDNIARSTDQTVAGISDVNRSVVDTAADVTTAVNVAGDGVSSSVDDLSNRQNADFGQIASDISSVGRDTQAGLADVSDETGRNFASVATNIAQGFDDNSAEGQAAKAEFLGNLDTVRNVVEDQNVQLSDEARQNFASLASSFDANGKLIENSIADTGNIVTRALDEQGNLFIAEFDAQGQKISQQSLDMNTMLSDVSRMTQEGFTSLSGQTAQGFDTLTADNLAGNA